MPRRLLRALTLFAALEVLGTSGCVRPRLPEPRARAAQAPKVDYWRELAPGEHALRKVTDPAQLPDFAAGLQDREGLLEAIERSLSYLSKSSSRRFFPQSGIAHDQVVRSLEVARDLLRSGLSTEQLALELRRRFDVYTSVGCDGRGTVLFTGYYTPVFEASLERSERYRYPLHRPPEGHVKDPITGETLGLRQADGSLDPRYPDRDQLLASGLLDGRELAWLANPFEAYLVGVQGSALLRLPDGRQMEVGYAGTNGAPYISLGLELVRLGKLRREELSLRAMLAHFEAHPDDLAPLMAANPRYVYFQESSGGPYGCLNEQVTPLRSIATDKSLFPRGALCFFEAPLPPGTTRGPTPDGIARGFALDQDAGGAIRAPGRCDLYMGTGELAGDLAGHIQAEGRLFYLILKDDQA